MRHDARRVSQQADQCVPCREARTICAVPSSLSPSTTSTSSRSCGYVPSRMSVRHPAMLLLLIEGGNDHRYEWQIAWAHAR